MSLVVSVVARIKVGQVLRACWAGLCSQTYRERLAREYVAKRIANWSARGQLDGAHAKTLHVQIEQEESSSYLTDFGVHLAVKPLVKVTQFWIMPALWMAGVIDEAFLAFIIIAGGCVVRTLYTLGRLVQNTLTGREKPWVALAVGVLPVVGNMAFPFQVIFSGAHGHRSVARFILFDTFARLGKWVPIWGGADTLTEHFVNRLPTLILRPDTSAESNPTEEEFSPPCDEFSRAVVPEPISV